MLLCLLHSNSKLLLYIVTLASQPLYYYFVDSLKKKTILHKWIIPYIYSGLSLNVSKGKVCTFTCKLTSMLYNYKIYDTMSARSNTVKDLGVTFA